MSTRNEKARVERPFKIDVYGLQDNYIGTLQSYGDSFLGQVVSPRLSISDDGTQTFTCSIPKYFIDPTTNEKKINPRWEDAEEGVLAENIRILKIFIQKNGTTEVYPMVIDTITDSRDSHFAIYKQVEASGLAFAELGKVGYKLELTKDTVLDEVKAAQSIYKWDEEYDNLPELEDNTIITNINYWLDKVFPNQKDENNNITKWLTPWCYEIRMDWRYYAENRDSSKVYDDAFISNWTIQGAGDKATLVPTEKTEQREKARLIDCKNSNKYNITQDIAEAFEVFCRYEYKCDQNGKFIKTYTDDKGKVWTGRKVIFYNRAIKQEDPIVVDYQKNLQSIERTSDSSEIYTKLYVTKLEAEEMSNGYVTIADTTANPLRDEFILNFDYLDSTGALSDYQRQFIGLYKTGIAEVNRKLIPLLETEEEGVADLVELKAKAAFYEHEETAAQEEYKYYKDLYDNFNKLGPVIKDKDNSYFAIFIEETKDSNCYYASLGLYGINAESIKLYSDSTYASNKLLNNTGNTKIVYSVPDTLSAEDVDNNLYIQLNEYGYPKRLYCHKDSIFNVGTAYLGLEYTPENEYETIYQYFENKILTAVKDKAEYENIVAAKVKELEGLEESVQALLKLKDDLNSKLERILGPALREGYWTPDEYEDHASQVIKNLQDGDTLETFWDAEAYSFETDGSYFINGVEGGRKYYPYIKLKESGIDFSKNAPNQLILYENGELQSAPITTEIPAGWKWFQIGDIRYYVNLPAQTPPIAGAEKKYFIFIKDNDNVSFTLPDKTIYTLADSEVFRTTAPSGDTVPNPISELRPAFDNINRNWTAHYYDVHFKYGYIDKEPCIILLTEDGNSLNSNSYFSYSFEGDNPIKDVTGGYVCNYVQPYIVEHARIRIKEKNVQTTSSLFTIVNLRNEKILERYKDYVVIISDSYPIITLKLNEKNSLDDLSNGQYKIGYTSSKANEYMYLDAVQVAKDNSIPRYTYSLQIANLPHDFSHIELGQMLYINDHSLGVHAATGYVNKIEYALDQPQEDGVEVQNYKTKFEDLFSTITAQSEAMKTNRRAYEIAAQAFTSTTNGGVMGQISGSVLQSALKNNSYLLNWSATGVEITPDQGIILTNKTPYSNGVTGQVILQGGGIFLSDSIDANGNRIWSQAITPHGINASLINAGQLNTDKILVYAGDNMAFQWNPEGIHAYKIDESGLHKDVYVKYSQHGLHLVNNSLGDWGDNLIDGMKSLVTINWDGLTLKNNSGETTLFADRDGNLSITGTLQSARFASGILGYGWQIRNDGTAEFQDVHVRGTISASIFEYKETTAVGGELYVGPTLVVDYNRAKNASIYMSNDASGSHLVLDVDLGLPDNHNLCGRTWEIGDVLGINCCLVNDAGIKYEIKNLRMRLDTIGKANNKDKLISSALWDTSLNVFYNEDGIPIKFIDVDWTGLKASGPINCIFIGSENDTAHNRKGILLTAMAENSPYMDIYDDAGSKIAGTPRVRLGNLNGLGTLTVDDYTITPGGYGLYSDNVYLTGSIYAINGKIGGWNISNGDLFAGNNSSSVHLSTSDSIYALWAGANEVQNAPFTLTKTGRLNATGATINGEIIAADENGNYLKATSSALGFFNKDNQAFMQITETGLALTGTITATGGTIGGWIIDDFKLSSMSNENIYLRGNPSDEDDPNVIHIKDDFIVDHSGNIVASTITTGADVTLSQVNLSVGNTNINKDNITINQRIVPSIIIHEGKNNTTPENPGGEPGQVLWLKPITSGGSGSVDTVSSLTASYSTSSGGSGQYYRWTNGRKNMCISGPVTDYGTMTGRARRGGYFTFNKKLVTASKYRYTLTIPLALGSAYDGMPPGATVHATLTNEKLSGLTALNGANNSYYNTLDNGPLGVKFSTVKISSSTGSTAIFVAEATVNLTDYDTIYFEVWTTDLYQHYISNVFNSKDGGNVTLRCEAIT